MATDGRCDPDALVVLTKSERRRRAKLRALPTWGETPEQTQTRRTALVKQLALNAGFSRVGIAQAMALPADQQALQRWLDAAMYGEMTWLAEGAARRCDPGLVVPGAQRVIVLALDYDTPHPHTHQVDLAGENRAWVSRYAWGDDYHVLIEQRLKRLEQAVAELLKPELGDHFRGPGGPVKPFKAFDDFRWSVDYGPVLERAWAQRAGLGWRGKHTLLVDPRRGSYFFLATVITTLALDVDPAQTDHCGSCTACIDACPTQAIVQAHVVDARRCISHATIEVAGELPPQARALVGDHLFGCDICQDVCPFNRFSQPCGEVAFEPRPNWMAPKLSTVLAMTDETVLARSAMRRRGLAGLQNTAQAVQAARTQHPP